MKLNLYKYHDVKDELVGHASKHSVPMVIIDDLIELRMRGGMSNNKLSTLLQELKQHRDLLVQDPDTAAEAAIRYRSASAIVNKMDLFNFHTAPTKLVGYKTSDSLFNRDPAVERLIATDPDAIVRYVRAVIEHVEPRYHEQILKSSPNNLKEYLRSFKRDLVARHQEFLKLAYKRISEDLVSAFDTMIFMGEGNRVRIPELEASVFQFEPKESAWRREISEPEYMTLPQTPDAGGDMGYFNNYSMFQYPEYDSPWNLYVSSLDNVKDRVAAIKQYGFKGREFKLGYNNEPG